MGLFDGIKKALGPVGDIFETAAAIKTGIDLFAGDDDVPSEVRQAGRDVSAISRALMDPNDPLFQRIAAEEEGLITRDFARALRDFGVQNVRQMVRTGGFGMTDPERRDEALAGAFAKSLADRKQAARDQARAYLGSALTANRAVAGAFAPMISENQRQREREASGMQFLLDYFQPDQPSGINFDISLMNPPNLAFDYGNRFGARSSVPAVSTYTTPGLSFGGR